MGQNNPLFEPIHGISLYDYSAANAKIANGVAVDIICGALGVEVPVWEDASQGWVQRMQEDADFVVISEMGTLFGQADQHPKLGHLQPAAGAGNTLQLERLATDRYFYEELCGARTAAYEAGLDGARWIQDNYGISLGDFQQVAMQWMEQQKDLSSEEITEYVDHMEAKRQEYAKRFADENGGNIADDVEF
ncbi:DUF6620 family protein [Chitinophaga filiformis]|uniref:Solute-binding protein family 3/N-terminal domain-containing protein n=1 Tax=Chitinophaga filiformis TaxID=104663 RepID=A0ABY4HXZ9_CHIFI|nr:DUF6620 family protein [Chitinophaga filiformis]UPK68703.1 hypothetical protein MYF79_27460 [Chitinophaga filiformis]